VSQARLASLPLSSYNFLQHFVYCFYPPLYIAGPIITFNDFASQLAVPIRQKVTEVRLPAPSNVPVRVLRARKGMRACVPRPNSVAHACIWLTKVMLLHLAAAAAAAAAAMWPRCV